MLRSSHTPVRNGRFTTPGVTSRHFVTSGEIDPEQPESVSGVSVQRRYNAGTADVDALIEVLYRILTDLPEGGEDHHSFKQSSESDPACFPGAHE
jgi:hypothetical protein